MKFPLVLPSGTVSDDTPFSTPGQWGDISNARYWRGKPQAIGGWLSDMDYTLNGVCRGVLAWTDNENRTNVLFATNEGLAVLRDGELSDITPAGYVTGPEHGAGGPGFGAGPYGAGEYGTSNPSEWFPRTWSVDSWGEQAVACYRRGPLITWENDPDAPATVIATAPDDNIAMVVTDSRQIMLLGTKQQASGEFNGLTIRYSAMEDKTDFAQSATNIAGEYTLKGSGSIVSGRRFGSDVLIWTDNSLYRAYYIGDVGTPWGFELIASGCGLIGPNAVKVIDRVAYWIDTNRQFRAYAPGGDPLMLPCPIRDEFERNLAPGQLEKICATSIGKFGEVWWFYPDARDGIENSRYVGVSTLDSSWTRGLMARSAAIDAGPLKNPLFVSPDGRAYSHENGDTANGAPLSGFIETSDVYIDSAERMVLIRGIWPDFEDQVGAITMTLKVRDYPQAPIREKGPYILQPGQSKRDFLVQGRIVRARFEWSSSPARLRFGKPSFEGVVTGQQ